MSAKVDAVRNETVPGDKRTRTIFFAFLVAAGVLLLLSPWLGELAGSYDPAKDPEQITQELIARIRLITALQAILFLAFTAYFAVVGFRTLHSRAWPPYGMKVPWPVVRRHGRYAIAMAVGNLLIASLFLVQVAVSIWGAWIATR